ncbi:MAG TPA: hypothetical protein VIL72_05595 [Beijerinckiaceae bacterium]|jgi:hypothetical protein
MKQLAARGLGLAILAATAAVASAAPAAASGRLQDGRWAVEIEGRGPHLFCYFRVSHVGEVRGGRPVYRGPIQYRLTVSRAGAVSAVGRAGEDHGSVRGRVTRAAAQGEFDVPTRNCRGLWQARRIGA